MKFRFGIHVPYLEAPSDAEVFPTLERIALTAERLGFETLSIMDHFIQIPGQGTVCDPILESWTALGALAARTSRIRLLTLVTGTPYRNPAHLAKIGATVDNISGGRLIMGIGAGWYQHEFDAYGFTFPPVGERIRRLDEAVQVIIAMWTQEHPTFEGRYYRIEDAQCVPLPVQKPRPPVLVGGGGERGTLRVAARWADASNFFGDPQTVKRKLQALARHCESLGRDPGTIHKSRLGQMLIARDERDLAKKREQYVAGEARAEEDPWRVITGTPQQCVEACATLFNTGLDGLIFSFPDAHTLEPLHLFAEEVMPALGRR